MKKIRSIEHIVSGNHSTDGAGVRLKRIFAYHMADQFDPFLMLDYFDSQNPKEYMAGFPWHPHRGIETVTYMLDGQIDHGDSLGNSGTVCEGCCQWMTAGSGIVHQEMPQAGQRLRGIQLWVNLPSDQKMISPAYRDIKESEIRSIDEEKTTVKVIAGEYKGVEGPISGLEAKPIFLDVEICQGETFAYDTVSTDTVFAFVFSGKGRFAPDSNKIVEKGHAVLYGTGERIEIEAASGRLHILLLAGAPLKEPIAWRGPIVMNTQKELDKADEELKDGGFIK